jgi:hypothetical protein
MSSVTASPAPVKPSRPLRLAASVFKVHGGHRILAIVSPGKRKAETVTTPYLITRIASPLGEAFSLRKMDSRGNYVNETYSVLLAAGANDEPHDRCDCMGHTAHQKCKHVIALRQLQGEGEL